jgi:hypothetical protein
MKLGMLTKKLVDPLDKLATATEQFVFLRIEIKATFHSGEGQLKKIFPFQQKNQTHFQQEK